VGRGRDLRGQALHRLGGSLERHHGALHFAKRLRQKLCWRAL